MHNKVFGLTGPSSFSSECIRMIEKFYGACPMLLYQNNPEHLDYLLLQCDAVFLAGGVDIHPRVYEQSCPVGKNMRSFDYPRDVREMRIIKHCLLNRIPMFGICRGHQMLGVICKQLTLLPDIAADASIIHSPSRQDSKFEADKENSVHHVACGWGFPQQNLWVNSFHHQGLEYDKSKHDKDPEIVGITAVDNKIDIIEMMISESQKWMSVQWHPEWDWEEQESSRAVLEHFRDRFLTPDEIQ